MCATASSRICLDFEPINLLGRGFYVRLFIIANMKDMTDGLCSSPVTLFPSASRFFESTGDGEAFQVTIYNELVPFLATQV